MPPRPAKAKAREQAAPRLTWAQALAWRTMHHNLARRAPRERMLGIVGEVCGLHAQLMSSAEVSLWARVEGLEPDAVERALWEERTLVKTWAMRGTLHLLPVFDSYVNGASRDSPAVLADAFRYRVYRTQGWISPVLLVDGVISGVWRHEKKGVASRWRWSPSPTNRPGPGAAWRRSRSGWRGSWAGRWSRRGRGRRHQGRARSGPRPHHRHAGLVGIAAEDGPAAGRAMLVAESEGHAGRGRLP